MNLFKKIVFFAAVILIQFSIFPRFTLNYYEPDLLLAITILLGLMRGPEAGCIAGLTFGLLVDVNAGIIIGASAFSWVQVAFAAALLGDRLLIDNPLVQMFVVGCGTLFAGIFQIFFFRFASVEDPIWYLFLLTVSRAVITSIVTYPIAKILLHLNMIHSIRND